MKYALMKAALLAALLAAPPVLAEEVSNLPTVGLASIENGIYDRFNGAYFVPQVGAWCVQMAYWDIAYGGCLPEYQIPPEQLRALRAAAGLPVDAPVWNGAKGEFVALPPSE